MNLFPVLQEFVGPLKGVSASTALVDSCLFPVNKTQLGESGSSVDDIVPTIYVE